MRCKGGGGARAAGVQELLHATTTYLRLRGRPSMVLEHVGRGGVGDAHARRSYLPRHWHHHSPPSHVACRHAVVWQQSGRGKAEAKSACKLERQAGRDAAKPAVFVPCISATGTALRPPPPVPPLCCAHRLHPFVHLLLGLGREHKRRIAHRVREHKGEWPAHALVIA